MYRTGPTAIDNLSTAKVGNGIAAVASEESIIEAIYTAGLEGKLTGAVRLTGPACT